MFAIYFSSSDGAHAFVAAVEDRHSAVTMGKLLSRQDPRDVLVIENLSTGDTAITGCYRHGLPQMDTRELSSRPDSPLEGHTPPDSSHP